MASLVATATFISRTWPRALFRRSVEGSLSSSVLQFRSYTNERLDGRVPQCPEASSTTHPSGKSPPAASPSQSCRAYRLGLDKDAYPVRKCEGFRAEVPNAVLESRPAEALLNEAKRPGSNHGRASRNVGGKSSLPSPWEGSVRGTELAPFTSASVPGIAYLAGATDLRQAIEVLKSRQKQGLSIDFYTLSDVLRRCSEQKDLKATRQVHHCIIQSGMDKNVHLGTTLFHIYIKFGSSEDARRLFDGLLKPDRKLITWNMMIGAYAKSGCGVKAYELFLQMNREGFIPDAITCLSILNASASEGALEWVKVVHTHALKAGLESDVRVGTALVRMYGKCGSIDDARRVFDRLQKRNVITWNVMIGAYAGSGCGMEAYKLFLQMQREGVMPDEFTCASILNGAGSAEALEWVKDVHSHALKAGLDSDLRVAIALARMYAKCGSIDNARQVFDRMEKRDLITWNVMIGAYAESGCGAEAYRLFVQMRREGFKPNAITLVSILNGAAKAGALEWVKQVHSYALQAGLESDVRVGTSLVRMYAKSGSLDDARLVFDRLPTTKRNIMTWNVIIGAYAESGCGEEAYRLFSEMKQQGCKPDPCTYASILNGAASAGALEWVKAVHNDAVKAGLVSNLRVGNALVHMYAKCGSVNDARQIFEGLENTDVITWNIMIGAYGESGRGTEAYQLYARMKREGVISNAITFLSILNVSASLEALEWVKEVHSHAAKAGLESDVRVGTALVRMYAKSGSLEDARLVFDRLAKRNVMTWNAMLGAYAESGCGAEAYCLFVQMNREGFTPDAFTYASILNGAASAGSLEWVKAVHSQALKAGLESDVRVGTALVHMYARSGSINDARLVFDRMVNRHIISWNVMIGGLAQHGRGHEALKLFKRMNAECVKPDDATFVAVLSACSHAGLVDDGRKLLLAMEKDYGVEPNVVHYNCMVDVLGRAGHLEEAKLLIDDMRLEPNVVTWKALLGACRTHCNVDLGELAAEEVFKLDPTDSAAHVLLSNIYAATGRWEKVVSVRNMMQKRGVRKEAGRSWIAVDDKIHEFAVGDTSHPESTAIYSVLQDLTEKLKAKGYIPDTNLVLHKIADEDKELALCSHSEKLAIAYGLLRVPRGKAIRIEKNLRICPDCHAATKLISDVTGREIIAKDANRFHHFKDGVCSCGDYW